MDQAVDLPRKALQPHRQVEYNCNIQLKKYGAFLEGSLPPVRVLFNACSIFVCRIIDSCEEGLHETMEGINFNVQDRQHARERKSPCFCLYTLNCSFQLLFHYYYKVHILSRYSVYLWKLKKDFLKLTFAHLCRTSTGGFRV